MSRIGGLLFYVVTFALSAQLLGSFSQLTSKAKHHLDAFQHLLQSCSSISLVVSLHCRNGHMAFTNINPDFSATKVVGGGPHKLFLPASSANFFFSSILNRTALYFMIQNKQSQQLEVGFRRPSFDRHDMTGQHQSF